MLALPNVLIILLQSAGLTIISRIISNVPKTEWFPPIPAPSSAPPGREDENESAGTKVRKDFRETFLWQNVLIE